MMDNLKILYVEDDPESREIMQVLVQEVMGVQHLTIFAEQSRFHCASCADRPTAELSFCLDIHVPPHNGFEMLEMLRQHDDIQRYADCGINGKCHERRGQKTERSRVSMVCLPNHWIWIRSRECLSVS